MNMIDRAADLLFPEDGRQRTLNVKFLCAGEDNVSAEALAEEIVRAASQIRSGTAQPVDSID